MLWATTNWPGGRSVTTGRRRPASTCSRFAPSTEVAVSNQLRRRGTAADSPTTARSGSPSSSPDRVSLAASVVPAAYSGEGYGSHSRSDAVNESDEQLHLHARIFRTADEW